MDCVDDMNWNIQDHFAEYRTGQWALAVELNNAGPRIRVTSSASNPNAPSNLDCHISAQDLSIITSQPSPIYAESFARQSDLIGRWSPDTDGTFGYQVDVKVIEEFSTDDLAFDLWLSVQTHLLDSHPQLQIRFDRPTPLQIYENVGYESKGHFVCAMHTLDSDDCRWEQRAMATETRLRVFDRFMEKGVIRRARLRLAVSSHKESTDEWDELIQSFDASPLPLTA